MKVAVCQINTTVGDFTGNFEKIARGLSQAHGQGADLAIFPELALCGYPPKDLLDKPYFVKENMEWAGRVAALTQETCGCIFGYASANPGRGRLQFNMAAFAAGGQIQFEQAKTLLPNYDVFDEQRHFEAAKEQKVFAHQGIPFGLTVCEDLWFYFDFAGRGLYHFDPIVNFRSGGAKLLFNLSASPFSLGKHSLRRKLVIDTAKRHGLSVIFCNLVGGNDDLVFDGRSLVVDAQGRLVYEAKAFEEDFFITDTEVFSPIPPPSRSAEEELFHALVLGLRDYTRKCHFEKVVVGLSGGIDSAVTAALAVAALGAKNVSGVAMPGPYSSEASLSDAKVLVENLAMDLRIVPINSVYQHYLETLGLKLEQTVPVAVENIQARIRGNILMAASNEGGALVLSTGNKSELAVGYCTLYGDLAGGLALISDVPKTLVYKLANFLNREGEVIPRAIIEKAPTAELKPNQKDEDTLPPYETLDAILKAYIEDHASLEEIVNQGFNAKVVEEVILRVDRNEYKRRQAPPGIKVTSKAFGTGRRFPIAWKYA